MYLRSRRRNLSLEVFLLSLIDAGLTTPYAMREDVGLSIGGTIPALRRLEKNGLVEHAVSGRRHEFSLTPKGRRHLKSDWRSDLELHTPTDLDDVLRTATLLWRLADVEAAREFLQKSEQARHRLIQDRTLDTEHLLAKLGKSKDATAYKWMKALADRARAHAEAVALRTIAKGLSKSSR